MPDFGFYWTFSGLFAVAAAAYAGFLGLLGVRPMISKRMYWSLWVVSVGLALAAWHSSAKQASDAAKEKLELLASFNRSEPRSAILPADAPTWLAAAYKEYGQTEISGVEENPRIAGYFKSLGNEKLYRDDVDDWASPFVEWCMQQAGITGPRSLKPDAWLSWGKTTRTPRPGAIVVLNFSGLKHVGFLFGEDTEFVRVLGGNQNDMVSVYRYPKSAVMGYRVP